MSNDEPVDQRERQELQRLIIRGLTQNALVLWAAFGPMVGILYWQWIGSLPGGMEDGLPSGGAGASGMIIGAGVTVALFVANLSRMFSDTSRVDSWDMSSLRREMWEMRDDVRKVKEALPAPEASRE